MQNARWYQTPLLLIACAVGILALPDAIEGPTVVEIPEGHAISLLDAFGIIPLAVVSLLLYKSLFDPRQILVSHPQTPVLFACGGVGCGMLLSSAFSNFYWWWAIGAVLFGGALTAISVLSGRE